MGRNIWWSSLTPTDVPSLLLPFLIPQQEEVGCKGFGGGGWCSWEFTVQRRVLCRMEERETRLVSKITLHHWVILCIVFGSIWDLLILGKLCQPWLLLLILFTCWHNPCEQLGSFRPRDRKHEAEGTDIKDGPPSFEDFLAAMVLSGFLKEWHLKMRLCIMSTSVRVISKEVKIFLLGMVLINPG